MKKWMLFATIVIVLAAVRQSEARNIHILMIGHSYFAGEDDMQAMVPAMLRRDGHTVTLTFRLVWADNIWRYHCYDTLVKGGGWTPTMDSIVTHREDSTKWAGIANVFKNSTVDYVFFIDGVSETKGLYQGYGVRIVAEKIRELSPTTVILPFAQHGFGSTLTSYYSCQNTVTASYHTIVSEPNLTLLPRNTYTATDWHYKRQEILRAVAEKAGYQRSNLFIVPGGEAFRIAHREKNDLSLFYRSLINRDAHGNLWGNYLNACVSYSVITGTKFNGIGYSQTLTSPQATNTPAEEYKGTVPDSMARYLEDVAFRAYVEEKRFLTSLSNGTYSGPWIPPVSGAITVLRTNYFRKLNTKGLITQSATLDTLGKQHARIFSEYNTADRLSRQTALADNGDTLTRTTYTYTLSGTRVTERRLTSKTGTYLGSDRYKYDPQGRLVEEAFYEPDSSHDALYQYQYNTAGQCVKKLFYSATGDLVSTTSFTYDTLGRQTNAVEITSVGDTTRTAFTYGTPVNSIQKIASARTTAGTGVPAQIIEYTYNAKGDITVANSYQEGTGGAKILSAVSTYTYEYTTAAFFSDHTKRNTNAFNIDARQHNRLRVSGADIRKIELFTPDGKKVSSITGSAATSISVPVNSSGSYVIRLYTSKGSVTQRIVLP